MHKFGTCIKTTKKKNKNIIVNIFNFLDFKLYRARKAMVSNYQELASNMSLLQFLIVNLPFQITYNTKHIDFFLSIY